LHMQALAAGLTPESNNGGLSDFDFDGSDLTTGLHTMALPTQHNQELLHQMLMSGMFNTEDGMGESELNHPLEMTPNSEYEPMRDEDALSKPETFDTEAVNELLDEEGSSFNIQQRGRGGRGGFGGFGRGGRGGFGRFGRGGFGRGVGFRGGVARWGGGRLRGGRFGGFGGGGYGRYGGFGRFGGYGRFGRRSPWGGYGYPYAYSYPYTYPYAPTGYDTC